MENTTLNQQEIDIIDEYFLNGYNKVKAYEKFRNNHASRNSLYASSSAFWKREPVKEYISQRQNEVIGNREQIINELLLNLKERIFETPIDSEYSYPNRQKDIELLIKISGIDKAPKYKEDIKGNSIFDEVVINIVGLEAETMRYKLEPGEEYE